MTAPTFQKIIIGYRTMYLLLLIVVLLFAACQTSSIAEANTGIVYTSMTDNSPQQPPVPQTFPPYSMRIYGSIVHYDGISRNGFRYLISRENNLECTIVNYAGNVKNMIIPDTINGMKVTAIGFAAFMNKQLTNIIIPDSVTLIRNYAFADNLLSGVIIGNSVTEIENDAFRNNLITEITIPESVTTIRSDAFGNNRLESVIINASGIDVETGALGQYTCIYEINGKQSGNYTSQGGVWLHDGNEVPAVTFKTGANVWLVSIDGRASINCSPVNSTMITIHELSRRGYSIRNSSPAVRAFHQGIFYLSPGTHMIEVFYFSKGERFTEYSTDSVLWEHQYLSEGFTYEATAEPNSDGSVINFLIKRL